MAQRRKTKPKVSEGTTGLTAERLEQAVEQLVRLVDSPSVTGVEAPAVDEAERITRDELGLTVSRMAVAPGRDNLLVGDPSPRVVLCTHLDTVPPHIGASRDDTWVHGRGSADAKGIAIAMVHALKVLEDAGAAAGLACLLVVGEESDHSGAKRAAEVGPRPAHIVLGEPCGLAPARAQKGLLKIRLSAVGSAGHSAYPDVGVSATHRLLDALGELRARPLPADDDLGQTTLNVGELSGGVAANVIAPSARALLLIRCAAPVDAVLAEVRERLGELVSVDELSRSEPVEFDVAGAERPGPTVPFNTDAHYLSSLGARMSLLGPGDMRCAHADGERLAIADLEAGILAYAEIARNLLG